MEKCLAHCSHFGILEIHTAWSSLLPDTIYTQFLLHHFLGCNLLSERPDKLKLCAHPKELYYLWMAHLRGIDVTNTVAVIR